MVEMTCVFSVDWAAMTVRIAPFVESAVRDTTSIKRPLNVPNVTKVAKLVPLELCVTLVRLVTSWTFQIQVGV